MDALEVQLTNAVSFQARVRETSSDQDHRMGRHQGDINAAFKMMENIEKKFDDNTAIIIGELERFDATIALMSDKLCNCGDKSPLLVGVGTQSLPFELEYATDKEYTIPPMVNTSPIPIPAPLTQTATPSDSDMENIPPPPAIPQAALQLIVDDEEEGEGHLKVSEGWLSEMREVCEASGSSSTLIQCPVGVQRARRGKGRFDPTFSMCCALGSRSNHAARMGFSPSKS
jgi:hypothetical protein